MQLRACTLPRNSLLVLLLVICVGAGTACVGSVTGGVGKVVAQADRSDPARAAVVEALAVADQGFLPILGAPYDEDERAAMIKAHLTYTGVLYKSMSSMELLRATELAADSARHVSVEVPGSEARYWEQDVLIGKISGNQKWVMWTFPVPYSDRKEVAADLAARIAPLFAVDPKWFASSNHDEKLNPLIGSESFMTYLSMGMGGDSESIMVIVDYCHEQIYHEAAGGIRLSVLSVSSTVK